MKNITIIAIITSILAILLLLNTCRLNRKIDSQNTLITQEQLAKQTLDSLVNQQKQTIYTQEVIIASNTQLLDNLTDSIFKLKKKDEKNTATIAYYQGRTTTEIRDVKVPYLDTTYMKQFSDSITAQCQEVIEYLQDSTILVGTVAADSTSNYSIKQTITRTGIDINYLSIPDTLNLRFIQHKGGLFKKAKVEIQYFHSNPLVKTTGSNSVLYIPKKKSFFTRVLLPVAIGVGGGLLINR